MKDSKIIFCLLMAITLGFISCSKDDDDANEDGVGKYKGHEYVDLGLPSGTMWATCNVGADIPTGFGYYYAWGETSAKSDYSYDTYKWAAGDYKFSKYVDDEEYGIVDNLFTLEKSDDAAYVAWGGNWRTPTYTQWKELVTNCSIEEDEMNGVDGTIFRGPNGHSIFIPKAGWMCGTDRRDYKYWYWSSSVMPNRNCDVCYFKGKDEGEKNLDHNRDDRPTGGTIRPVYVK